MTDKRLVCVVKGDWGKGSVVVVLFGGSLNSSDTIRPLHHHRADSDQLVKEIATVINTYDFLLSRKLAIIMIQVFVMSHKWS